MRPSVRRQQSVLLPLDLAENAGRIRAHLRGVPPPLRATVELWLEVDAAMPLIPVPFVADSGASYSQITSHEATTLQLPIPAGLEVECVVNSAVGRKTENVRPSHMKVWWNAQRGGDPFEWPLLFRMMKEAKHGEEPPAVPPVLGLGGVIRDCRWTFDGTYTYERPLGSLLLEDVRI